MRSFNPNATVETGALSPTSAGGPDPSGQEETTDSEMDEEPTWVPEELCTEELRAHILFEVLSTQEIVEWALAQPAPNLSAQSALLSALRKFVDQGKSACSDRDISHAIRALSRLIESTCKDEHTRVRIAEHRLMAVDILCQLVDVYAGARLQDPMVKYGGLRVLLLVLQDEGELVGSICDTLTGLWEFSEAIQHAVCSNRQHGLFSVLRFSHLQLTESFFMSTGVRFQRYYGSGEFTSPYSYIRKL